MTYFEDKPFVLQIHHDGEWWTSDWFTSIEEARRIGRKKTTPWRVIRYTTGAVVSCGTPVHIHTTTSPYGDFDIFDWNRWLHTASILELHVEVSLLELAIVIHAAIWEESDGEQREKAAAKVELFYSQLHAVGIEIEKRKQSQYVALYEN